MPKIIPIRDLKDTNTISLKCKESKEPIFVTKNGYGDMVIMSLEVYEDIMENQRITNILKETLDDLHNGGKTIDGDKFLEDISKKYGV